MAFQQAFAMIDSSQHDLKSFDCGKTDMNRYLTRYAEKNQKLGLSATWVLPVVETHPLPKTKIAAYYSLASTTVTSTEIPADYKLPRYPVPVVLLARLAVEQRFQRQGLGEKTLVSALRHCVVLTGKGLPAYGLVLDVLDAEALVFYQRFGLFKPLNDHPMRLFVGMHVLRQI